MKVGLYFGSFNPIHIGHCIIANHVANNTDVEQVWFVVSPQNPFKSAGSLLNEYHRLHLVQRAIEAEPALKASDIEFRLPRPSYTAETLAYLAEKYPSLEFVLVIGSDSLHNLQRWKNAAFILSNFEIYVYLRPGFLVPTNFPAKLNLLDAPLLEISSTQIRQCVKYGKSISFLVPTGVKEEIDRAGYYK